MERDPNDPDQLSGYDESQRAEIEEAEGEHQRDGVLVTDLARERPHADAAVRPEAAEEQLHATDGGPVAGGSPNKPGADPERPADTPATETQDPVTPEDYPDTDGGRPDYR